MNAWDNFVLALRIAGGTFAFGLVAYVNVRWWLRIQSHKLPSEDFTDEQYADGFYIPKERIL